MNEYKFVTFKVALQSDRNSANKIMAEHVKNGWQIFEMHFNKETNFLVLTLYRELVDYSLPKLNTIPVEI